MKPETIVSALEEATVNYYLGPLYSSPRTERQIAAFRSRILRMFAEKDAELTRLRAFRNERLKRALDEFSKENF